MLLSYYATKFQSLFNFRKQLVLDSLAMFLNFLKYLYLFEIANVLGLQTDQGQKCLRVTSVLDLQTSQGYKQLKITNVSGLQAS